MASIPPPPNGFASYPRTTDADVARLESLVEGYFGLNKAVLANLVMLIGLNIASAFVKESNALMLIPLLLAVPVVLFFVSRPHVAKIGEGLGWTSGTVNGYCVLIAMFFWFCFGVIGFVIVQNKAMAGLKEFGFQSRGLFTGKKIIMAFVERYKAKAQEPAGGASFGL